jgi:hypothetical protein
LLARFVYLSSQQVKRMHSAENRAGRNPQLRRGRSDRALSGGRADLSRAASLREPLEASLDEQLESGRTRWSLRSSFLLIVSVGTIFWGGVWWLIFG